jgi:hypothetical protein
MESQEREALLAEEALIILHSGEIPEIAFHSSLYYLAEDPDGPKLTLAAEEIVPLQQAVSSRYREIILRDLTPENRSKRIYRGMARCAANWHRWLAFCARQNLDPIGIRDETAAALQNILAVEMAEAAGGGGSACLNCPAAAVENLAKSLGLAPADLPDGWQQLCPEG